jgi:hypothetical protein
VRHDPHGRLAHALTGDRVQLTTDGHKAYLRAVEGAFGADVDYAMLVKLYGAARESLEGRYSAECIGARKERIEGRPAIRHNQHVLCGTPEPEYAHVDASVHPIDECVCQHKTLRISPALATGLTTRLWDMADIVKLVGRGGAGSAARIKSKVLRINIKLNLLTAGGFDSTLYAHSVRTD